jgi:hypothetical protein
VQVADAQEAELLAQAAGAPPVLGGQRRLYFPAALAERLRGAGYEPVQVDAGQVVSRVVRVYAPTDAAIRAAGVRVLRKYPAYWLAEGTLEQLRRLRGGGVVLAQPGPSEPTPLEVRVTMPRQEDVQRVNALGVDIFQAGEAGGRWTLTGGAYEWQIDAMTTAGYTVERISTVPSTEED